jgi:serine protease AprX
MKSQKRIRIKLFCLLVIGALVLITLTSSPRSGAQIGVATLADWRAKVDARVLDTAALGQTEFLIYMKQQADLSGSKSLATKNEKGQFVYDRLTAVAQATQANVKQTLSQRSAPYKSFWISNTIWAKGDLTVLQAVAVLPEVAAVYPVGKGALKLPPQEDDASRTESPTSPNIPLVLPTPEPGLQRVNADDVWALGYEGQGVVVAGADTGVRWTHNALKNQYRGWNGITADHNYNWHDAIHIPNWPPDPSNVCNPGGVAGAGQPSPVPCDDDQLLGGGHGSHTVGTMVGDDGVANFVGMAPQAKWMACRNMSQGVGAIPTYLECMEWFIAPTDSNNLNPDTSKAPHVINNSWGCVEGCPPDPNPLRDSLKASRAAGIVYVASAGNDGIGGPGPAAGCNTVYHPLARYAEAFSVGATTHDTDVIAEFSSRGPTAADPENPGSPLYMKPNITAPGVTIRSAQRANDDAYDELDGTSMAGPHVAGLVALVISANPALAGDVDRIEEIIEQSAVKKTTTEGCGGDTSTQVPNNTYGWGRIDALAAVNLALEDVDTTLVNYALTVLGSVPSASSTYTTRNYSMDSAFDGERAGGAWEQGGGWNDATRDQWPDNLDITFGGGAKLISEIRVYTVQNNFHNPVVPDENTDASLYGIQDFEVQAFNGVLWVTVPGGTIIGNTKALRVITLNTPVTTTGIRVLVNMGRAHYSRIVELECYGAPGQ